jgi:hypothetical protein
LNLIGKKKAKYGEIKKKSIEKTIPNKKKQ